MTVRRILTLICAAFLYAEARHHDVKKRDTTSICDPGYNTTAKIQCYCVKDTKETGVIRSADCYVTTETVKHDDATWDMFSELKHTQKLTLTNNRGIPLKFIPTNALKYTTSLHKLDIKYGVVERVQAFAFANSSSVEEITLRDSQIKILEINAFAHHKDLAEINLDQNNIEEINRDVFIDLPSLEKLFLTSNKITTLHDRAFVHLTNLKELEINMNNIFSLNSETFSGLKKLQKLDLSSNGLEVIGDNTFLPLGNLISLNLEGNRIQMLDEKAFNGLVKLQSLTLAHNKLSEIDNVKAFEGLDALISLSLRANGIKALKSDAMAPILSNFYEVTSNLDVEENNFTCNCNLDWFLSLMNRTQSKNLKIAMENLKCVPDPKIRETWNKIEEDDKNGGQIFEEEPQQGADYEYYDESQLNGKLFYIDVRYLLNCSGPAYRVPPQLKTEVIRATTTVGVDTTLTTKATSRPLVTYPHKTGAKFITTTTKPHSTKVTSQGLLDLSVYDTTPKSYEDTFKGEGRIVTEGEKKPNLYTTSRLATVSAKPIENQNMYGDMASDEAKPDKLKAHRSIQQDYKDTSSMKLNSAHRSLGCAIMISVICARLLY